jgi:hypothetical protein
MKKPILLPGLLALAMLTACSKQAPTPPVADDDEVEPVAKVKAPPPLPSMSRADFAAGLLVLIDTAPQCQPFRAQLEQAGSASTDPLSPEDRNGMNKIVADAHAAGCSRKQ